MMDKDSEVVDDIFLESMERTMEDCLDECLMEEGCMIVKEEVEK
jgi:hypothetical protein